MCGGCTLGMSIFYSRVWIRMYYEIYVCACTYVSVIQFFMLYMVCGCNLVIHVVYNMCYFFLISNVTVQERFHSCGILCLCICLQLRHFWFSGAAFFDQFYNYSLYLLEIRCWILNFMNPGMLMNCLLSLKWSQEHIK